MTVLLASLVLVTAAAGPAAAAPANPASPTGNVAPAASPTVPKATLTYPHLALPGKQWAAVYSDGLAEVHSGAQTKLVRLPMSGSDASTATLPSKASIMVDLLHANDTAYAAQQVVVVYRAGVTASTGRTAHTNVAPLNQALSSLGVDRTDKLFAGVPQNRLDSMRATAQRKLGRTLLDFGHAYVLHLTESSVAGAVARLRANPDVAYAAPNWTVTTTNTPSVPIPATATAAARRAAAAPATTVTASGVPTNFALTESSQALLDHPGVDAIPAYAQIAAHGQLPGQGEIITNVSLGDLTDASAAADPNDPCNFFASVFGPTTVVQNGQRYIDWPSMPLIPTYTSNAAGALDPTGETCNQDPQLTEVGLDFSMMAPLPHDQQRPDALGSGLTDLLGIAPGASYRLVIPGTAGGAVSDVDAAFLAAANQNPRPNVITASLSFGLDQFGFSSRFLDEDPMTEAIIASIVHSDGIVVCVSSGDGLRTFTNAPVAPSGGAVATDLASNSLAPTDINDVAFSGAISRVLDSGAIDVGGSTLNDIFSYPPNDPRNAAFRAQQAFPTVRYNGPRNYASGFGDRVDVSAPGDNVVSFNHPFGGDARSVAVILEGGTSASAPEVAAAAAVVLQVARLTHDTSVNTPTAVRSFLAQTGTKLPAVPQSDLPINVGPQIDLGNAVKTLFARHGSAMAPGVARVAVSQRQQASALGGSITTTTDPTNISMAGRLSDALITVAPDWVGLPSGVKYQLSAGIGPHGVLATTPWARVYPSEILGAAGLSLVSTTAQSVPLVYTATLGPTTLATANVTVTLGPTDGTVNSVRAPIVDPVVRGATMRVAYDIHNLTGATAPTLVVSQPGRVESATGLFFRPSFSVPLTAPSGVVNVPVSALEGAGIYGVGIQQAPGGWTSANLSAFAFTRVAPTGDTQPDPPLVGSGGQGLGHFAEPAYGAPLRVSFDVRNVTGADGAIIEVSSPGPTVFNSLNPFNNPNGSQRDANGHDSGSTAYVPVSGNHGTVTLSAATLGLDATMNQVIRVLATKHGQVVGEASGVSTVSMDGVRPADGGAVAAGFGVNADGSNGWVTSNGAVDADGNPVGSVETFRQSDNRITHTVRSSSDFFQTLNGGCPGQFAGGLGLYQDFDADGNGTNRVLDVGSGTDTGTWTPPDSLGGVICEAGQQDSPDVAILGGSGGQNATLNVSTTNLSAGSFSAPIDLSPALDPNALTIPGGIGQDTGASEAIVPVVDAFNPNSPGRIVVAHLDTGTVDQFPAVNTFFVSGVAVDPTTHRALIPSNDTFGLYDLSARTGTAFTLGGSSYQHPAADPAHGRFLMQEVAPPDFFGTAPNNNAMSAIDVIDEQGNLVQRIEQFNFFNIFLLDMGSYLQVSPATTTGYTLGPAGGQLAPFTYNP